MSEDSKRQVESRRIIGRVGAESDASMMQRAQNHMNGNDADQKDWAELWGTRIGRWLGLALLIYLVVWLISYVTQGG